MPKHSRTLKTIQQAQGKKFWEVRSLADDTGENAGEVYIYGVVVGQKWFDDDVAPKALKDEIDALGDIDTLYVRINSPGGNVFAGIAIYNILRRVDADVVVTVDGIAASAASVIAMSGDKVIAQKGSMIMIHNAWTFAVGDANKLRKTAGMLDQVQKAVVEIYQGKTGLDESEIIKMLDEETWMSASDAKDLGFVDQIDEDKEVAASIAGDKLIVNGQEFDASIFGVLPPLNGVAGGQEREGKSSNDQSIADQRFSGSPSAWRQALGVLASALGLNKGDTESDEVDDPDAESNGEGESGNDIDSEKQEANTKGSVDQMSDVKNKTELQDSQSATPQTDSAPVVNVDIENMDREELMNMLNDLQNRTKAAEAMARAEREQRVLNELTSEISNYGVLPESPEVLARIVHNVSENKATEDDVDKLKAFLRATGEALASSDLFKPMGSSGEGDSSPRGQYRSALAQVKQDNPELSDAEASIAAFNSLPEDVQAKVAELNVL